jgi:outer membrane protein OmpA-like peptidoglycan-associated protein
MNRLKTLLLACAIVPLSQMALPTAASAEGILLAQADPACQPGDPNCVPPEKVVPRQKEPEAPPPPKEEAAPPPPPKEEAAPPPRQPEPEVQPERPAPQPEAQPEAPAPKQEVAPPPREPERKARPERRAPEPEAQPERPAPQPEAQPEAPAPKQEAAPPARESKPKARPERPAPQPEAQPERPAPKPEAQPEQPAPKPEAQPEQPAPQPEARPEPSAPKPEAQPERPAPQPEGRPDDGNRRPKGEPPMPPAQPDGQPPMPPAQPGGEPPPPPPPGAGAGPGAPPPPALIEKLGNPGAGAAEAIDRSVDQKAGNIRDVQRERRVISNDNGVRVTVEPGGRIIVQSGDEAVIRHDDRGRFDRDGRDVIDRPTRDGGREVIVDTRDGGRVRTVYDRYGMMVLRERLDDDGRSYVLFDNRSYGPGPVDEPGWQPIVRLPPPRIDMPRDRYRVEMRSAPPRYVEEALTAPPLVEVQPQYTLNQVIYSPDLRARVRSVDLDSITFSTGAWSIERSEIPSLEAVARGIDAALRRNPNEVFLVEGYTDAVGSVVDNLSLSDRRAEAVANVLTDHYDIPPENLVTQGYGESYLKVQTDGPERANRRVTVRRITPLLSTSSQR